MEIKKEKNTYILLFKIFNRAVIMNLPAIRINPLGVTVVLFVIMFFISLYATGFHKKQDSKLTTISLKHLLAVGINAAEMGGSKVREIRMSSNLNKQSKGETKEGADDPLTEGDLQSHRVMFFTLKKTFPDLKIVSEEHDVKQMESPSKELPVIRWDAVKNLDDALVPVEDVVVWIDPLDATQEYTENLVKYVTIMVCVSVKGKPVIGIIHQPFDNQTAWAWVDYGTSTNLLFASKYHVPDDEFRIIISRSHPGKVEDIAKSAFGPKAIVTEAGGAGYKVLQVAQGKADVYIHVTAIKKWDICAGNAVLNALHGSMTTLDGQLIDYGDPANFKNENGLITSLAGNEKYVKKLSGFKI